MLLTQCGLCLFVHKYLQFKISAVPSTNRKGYSWESSGSLPYGAGCLLSEQSHTKAQRQGSFGQGRTRSGQLEKGPIEKIDSNGH